MSEMITKNHALVAEFGDSLDRPLKMKLFFFCF